MAESIRRAQSGKTEGEQVKTHAHQRRRIAQKAGAAGHDAYARAGIRVGEKLGAHAVGDALMPDGRHTGKYIRQVCDIQPTPDSSDAAQAILRHAHEVERRAGEDAHFTVGGEQTEQLCHAVAVGDEPSCGAEIIPFGIEGLGRACGELDSVVLEQRQEKADAVSVGEVGDGGNAPGIIAGADGKRLKHALTHDVIKRHAGGAFHDDARDACAEVAIMEGFARTGRKPVFLYPYLPLLSSI